MANKKYEQEKDVVQRRPMMEHKGKEQMMAVLLQNLKAFQAVYGMLQPDSFEAYDGIFRLLWTIVCQYYEKHAELPEGDFLLPDIEDALSANPNMLNDAEVEALSDFVSWAYDPKNFTQDVTKSDSYAAWAIDRVKIFLKERVAAKARAAIIFKNHVAVALPDLFEQFHQDTARIDSLNTCGTDVLFHDNWDKRMKLEKETTGLSIFDRYMGGGDAPGEVIGLEGPFGSAKTTIAAMLAVESAKLYYGYTAAPDYDGRPKVTFVVTYEDSKADYRQRLLGYGAKILRSSLEAMNELDDLSRMGALLPYEQRIFKKQLQNGDDVAGEYERAQQLISILNDHVAVLDMTGNDEKGVGGGGVQEIAHRISFEMRKRNCRVGRVIIDYAGALVQRLIDANDRYTQDDEYSLLNAVPLQCKNRIAVAFQTCVYLLHQLSGHANSFSPTVLPTHVNAKGTKSWGENLNFNFCIGVPTKTAPIVALFGCTKHRRQPPLPISIIKIEGQLNRVRDVSNKFTLNAHQRQILKISDVNKLPLGAANEAKAAKTANAPDLDSNANVEI